MAFLIPFPHLNAIVLREIKFHRNIEQPNTTDITSKKM